MFIFGKNDKENDLFLVVRPLKRGLLRRERRRENPEILKSKNRKKVEIEKFYVEK